MADIGRRLGSFTPYIVLGILLFIIVPVFFPSYVLTVATKALIFAIFAVSLDLLMGYTGLPSFGHAAPFGAAAYTAGLLVTHGFQNPGMVIAASILVAAVVSAVFGFLAVRTAQAYFLIITLALGQIVYSAAYNWSSLTGGSDGLPGITRPDFGLPWEMTDRINFYFMVLFFLILAVFLMWRFVSSPFGRGLVGIRQNEPRMKALGYNTFLHKYICFIVAGAFAGLAGVLYAYFFRYVSPSNAGVAQSGEAMLMVILGGAGTLFGPAIGAVVLVFLKYYVSIYTVHWPLILGVIFVLAMLFAPKGIGGYLQPLWRRISRYGSTED